MCFSDIITYFAIQLSTLGFKSMFTNGIIVFLYLPYYNLRCNFHHMFQHTQSLRHLVMVQFGFIPMVTDHSEDIQEHWIRDLRSWSRMLWWPCLTCQKSPSSSHSHLSLASCSFTCLFYFLPSYFHQTVFTLHREKSLRHNLTCLLLSF